jgi:formylglycine-generating enzyme required for sulfatase activity
MDPVVTALMAAVSSGLKAMANEAVSDAFKIINFGKHTMIEVLTFFNSVARNKWIPLLRGKLKQICMERKKELNDINKIMFGDPLELAQYYVEPDCQEMNPAVRRMEDEMVAKQPIMLKINQFFKQKVFHDGSNQLVILSDAGMGKSALLVMLKLMHLTNLWHQDFACVLKKLGRGSIKEMKAIKNQRDTILLLDSLDEDPKAHGRAKDRLLDLLEVSQPFAKVIITCRTQFFPPGEKHEMELPGQVCVGPYRCYSKYLSFFNNPKVYDYLAKRFPKRFLGLATDQKKIGDAKTIIAKMGTLRCRPMLLSCIEDLMASTSITKGASEYCIFNALFDSWLRREQTKKPDLILADLHDACVILAVWMQIRNKRDISEAELHWLIEEIAMVRTIAQIDMKGRPLLNRNSDGDYRFSHYAIQEFCVAKFFSGKSIFRPKEKIPINRKIVKMLNESGKIDSDLCFDSLDLSLINLPEEPQQRMTILGMEFVYIPPGLFKMGNPLGEADREKDETSHMVLLSQGFYMQTTPVTQNQWEAVVGRNPSRARGDGDKPVECVSWHDVRDFIKRLNNRVVGMGFRLPAEAQWEYACRAGTRTKYYTGDTEADLDRAGWYRENANNTTHPVAQREPNSFGLYDMHGNVWEWMEDDWHDNYQGAPLDGSAWVDNPRCSYRVVRGGSWYFPARYCRSTYRHGFGPGFRLDFLGFRLVLLPGRPG